MPGEGANQLPRRNDHRADGNSQPVWEERGENGRSDKIERINPQKLQIAVKEKEIRRLA